MGKVRRPKGVLMFDTSARKSYLTGFRKRKQERREKAKLELEEQARKDKIAERKDVCVTVIIICPLSLSLGSSPFICANLGILPCRHARPSHDCVHCGYLHEI
eukprot:TRINITY_DN3773_c0_g1_i1.p1 TRINITY_DN3773_c0_g1~~TRINITY_DN3773_c0_g1_i1.p1  ORF type:complete len:103 (-),score=4.89 TRINITY_DN3773_c0_g1_i1:27-335(-)